MSRRVSPPMAVVLFAGLAGVSTGCLDILFEQAAEQVEKDDAGGGDLTVRAGDDTATHEVIEPAGVRSRPADRAESHPAEGSEEPADSEAPPAEPADDEGLEPGQSAGGTNVGVPRTRLPISLYAGTALPQTLPTGTAVGFSIDYRFEYDAPQTGAVYLWVIERGDGDAHAQRVALKQSGNLALFLPWRPEQRPFRSKIVEALGESRFRDLSAWKPMR